jgi:hypothetical protein
MLERLHGWVRRMAWPAGLCPVLFASIAPAADRVNLDAVSVHLFLQTAGTLSADVTAIEGFSSWNFVPQNEGFGDQERFDDIVIRVRLTAPKEVFARGPQAEVVVTDTRTKKVVARKQIADVYIGPKGSTFVPVYIANVACRPLKLTVTSGGKRIEKSLEFRCGE